MMEALAFLLVSALFIGGVWRFGKDLEDATEEMLKKRKEDEDRHQP